MNNQEEFSMNSNHVIHAPLPAPSLRLMSFNSSALAERVGLSASATIEEGGEEHHEHTFNNVDINISGTGEAAAASRM
jgi:hypothetical protein